MEITGYALAIWFVSLLIGSLGVVVFTGGNNRSSRMFLITVSLMALWTASVGLFTTAQTVELATWLVKLCYFWGTAIGIFFLFFFIVYPYDTPVRRPLFYGLIASLFAFFYLYFFTDLIIAGAFYLGGIAKWGWHFGPLWFLFYLIFYGSFLSGFTILFRKAMSSESVPERKNMFYIFWGILILISPPTLVNIILPQFHEFSLIWLGPIMSIGWVSVIAYSIVRHRQMNIKVFTTEVLALVMAAVFFANIFADVSWGTVGRASLFLVFLVLGYFLIRSIMKEARQAELLTELNTRLKHFNAHLQERVSEQTQAIKKSYEIERKARMELEKLNDSKNQFIMITEHHLRTPLTTIRWYLESLLHGEFGPPGAEITKVLQRVRDSTERLTHIINNFLDIIELKAGKDILDIVSVGLKPIVDEVLQELIDEIGRMKLTIDCDADNAHWPAVLVDPQKFKEVVFIVFDNAVRYNKKGGYITVVATQSARRFVMTVENSGRGIPKEEQSHLLTDLFERGESAKKVHPTGMGVGLALARSIIEAHHGSIRIESAGEEAVVKVFVELPVA